jgi:hemolysin activation/secretion protein
MRRVRAVLVVLAAGGFMREAPAQTPQDIERAQQQNQQLIQQEQQRERQQREIEEQRRRVPSGEALKPKPLPEAPAGAAACSKVTEIVLEGATKLDSAEQARLAAPYLGKCLTLADINRLIAEITNRYVELGFVTTRVYIPQQDLGSGRLQLKIVEGRIQSLIIRPEGSASAATAFPGLVGQVLNLRDLEQGIDQINRLASNSAKIDIEPGDEPGASQVIVGNEARKRWLASASVDNSGAAATGRNLFAGFLGVDNLLGLNDYFNATGRYSEKSGHEYTESGGLYGSVPYGYWTFSSALNSFRYVSMVQGTVSAFETRGTSDSQMLRADRVVFRDQARKWSFGGGVTLKQTNNFIAGTRIDNSSADLTVLDLGSNLSWITGEALLSFDLGVAAGVDALGATRDDPARPSGAPQAKFSKLTYGASLLRPFKAGSTAAYFQSRLLGQSSSDSLYGTEQIAIGNLYTVRGFRTTSLPGRSGYYVRNDLGFQLPMGNVSLRPYVGYDFGHVESAGTLQGWTLGADVSIGGATLALAYSRPVSVPTGIQKESGWLYGRLAFSF